MSNIPFYFFCLGPKKLEFSNRVLDNGTKPFESFFTKHLQNMRPTATFHSFTYFPKVSQFSEMPLRFASSVLLNVALHQTTPSQTAERSWQLPSQLASGTKQDF